MERYPNVFPMRACTCGLQRVASCAHGGVQGLQAAKQSNVLQDTLQRDGFVLHQSGTIIFVHMCGPRSELEIEM